MKLRRNSSQNFGFKMAVKFRRNLQRFGFKTEVKLSEFLLSFDRFQAKTLRINLEEICRVLVIKLGKIYIFLLENGGNLR